MSEATESRVPVASARVCPPPRSIGTASGANSPNGLRQRDEIRLITAHAPGRGPTVAWETEGSKVSWIHWHVVAANEDGTGTFVGPNFDTLQEAEAGARAYAAALSEDGWVATPNAYGLSLERASQTAQLGFTSCTERECT